MPTARLRREWQALRLQALHLRTLMEDSYHATQAPTATKHERCDQQQVERGGKQINTEKWNEDSNSVNQQPQPQWQQPSSLALPLWKSSELCLDNVQQSYKDCHSLGDLLFCTTFYSTAFVSSILCCWRCEALEIEDVQDSCCGWLTVENTVTKHTKSATRHKPVPLQTPGCRLHKG